MLIGINGFKEAGIVVAIETPHSDQDPFDDLEP